MTTEQNKNLKQLASEVSTCRACYDKVAETKCVAGIHSVCNTCSNINACCILEEA